MKRWRWLAGLCRVWLLLGLLCGIGQARAFELGAQPSRVDLGAAVEYLEDPRRQLQLTDLEQPEVAARFQPWRVSLGSPSFGYTDSAYWLRLCLSRMFSAGTTSLPKATRVKNGTAFETTKPAITCGPWRLATKGSFTIRAKG